MNLNELQQQLHNHPETIAFADTMAVIEGLYDFTPTAFTNGEVHNEAGQNNGSCKLFAFARLQGFNQQQTLACFGAFYRDDVLGNPAGQDHQNIRNFINNGWDGIEFAGQPLTPKA
ncbi:HopJ type III effector protein [Oceanisphaera arctica]|uniref:Type III effector n=1 Tax=Oceanisphaera arctica TaxID=641510 RepID=A0A2P5TMI2_9GAMM|nr:HopJ type III effector protein [Oceanisphaera arctica]PPL16644.1 type III effector [Oceanisphaera arctica]GHA21144.1 type III effector [Oceanisphaera arctica]